jgi:hypothetical protein
MRAMTATMAMLLLLAAPASAGNPAESYRRLYGEREKKVTASATKEDDAKLAADILAGAAEVGGDREFQDLLYEKAYEIGRRGKPGYRTAIDALQLLGESVAEREAGCEMLRLDVFEDLYRYSDGDAKVAAGEELVHERLLLGRRRVKAKLYADARRLFWDAQVVAANVDSARRGEAEVWVRAVDQRMKLLKKADALARRLVEDPADKETRFALVRTFLVDLDDPTMAGVNIGPGVPSDWVGKILHAATQGPKHDEPSVLALGEWYLERAKEAKGVPRRLMLMRSHRCFLDYVARHKGEDDSRLRAKLRITECERGIWETDRELVRRAGRNRWINLLNVTDPARDATAGRWSKDEVGLHSGGSRSSSLYFPVKVEGSYELEVFFRRLTGSVYPTFVLPCGEDGGLLVFGGKGNDKVGLHEIKRRSVDNNETTRTQPIVNGRAYRVRARVDLDGANVTIKAWLDGREIISWRGKQEWFRHKARKADRWLGLEANRARIEFLSVRLRIIQGKAELLSRE